MGYREQLLAHLAAYKHDVLGITQPGIFRYRQRDLERQHILPKEERFLNFVPSMRGQIRGYLDRNPGIGLHRYFHHLNSSQAFAFNLFVPHFGGGEAAEVLLAALGDRPTLVKWKPEAVPSVKEGTNLDARWETSGGHVTICEVKLTESGWGRPKNDERHREKLKNTYRPLLEDHVDSAWLKPKPFFGSYQIFRNIWHLLQPGVARLVFLLPRANRGLMKKLDATLGGVEPATRRRISVVAVEDVLAAISDGHHGGQGFDRYAAEMAEKYLLLD